jgi:hypothetical protein
VGRYEEACHYVTEYKRLLQFLEQQGDDASHDENDGKILN